MMQVDYITLTLAGEDGLSWERAGYTHTQKFRLKGFSGETYHFASGTETKARHAKTSRWLMQASGARADVAARRWAAETRDYIAWSREAGIPQEDAERSRLSCTRLDIKVDLDGELDGIAAKEALEAASWGHRPPKIECYRSTNDTLYIGAKGARKRWRIYEKWPGVTRWELQLRNSARNRWAYAAWMEYVRSGTDGLAAIVASEWGRIPDVGMGGPGRGERWDGMPREPEGGDWLEEAVLPYLDKRNPELVEAFALRLLAEYGRQNLRIYSEYDRLAA